MCTNSMIFLPPQKERNSLPTECGLDRVTHWQQTEYGRRTLAASQGRNLADAASTK